VRYQLTFVYRDTAIAGGCGWTVDVADTFGAPVLCGVPLITGSNLLGQYQYLDFLGGLLVLTDGFMDGGPVPGFYDLGSSSNVYWVTNQ
jgi:hypothetical protein